MVLAGDVYCLSDFVSCLRRIHTLIIPHSCSNSHEDFEVGIDTTMRVTKSQKRIFILINLNCILFLDNTCITTRKGYWTSRDFGSAEIHIQPGWAYAEAGLNWNWTRKVVEEKNNGIMLWLMWFTGQKNIFFSLLICSCRLPHMIKSIPTNPEVMGGQGTVKVSEAQMCFSCMVISVRLYISLPLPPAKHRCSR